MCKLKNTSGWKSFRKLRPDPGSNSMHLGTVCFIKVLNFVGYNFLRALFYGLVQISHFISRGATSPMSHLLSVYRDRASSTSRTVGQEGQI